MYLSLLVTITYARVRSCRLPVSCGHPVHNSAYFPTILSRSYKLSPSVP